MRKNGAVSHKKRDFLKKFGGGSIKQGVCLKITKTPGCQPGVLSAIWRNGRPLRPLRRLFFQLCYKSVCGREVFAHGLFVGAAFVLKLPVFDGAAADDHAVRQAH